MITDSADPLTDLRTLRDPNKFYGICRLGRGPPAARRPGRSRASGVPAGSFVEPAERSPPAASGPTLPAGRATDLGATVTIAHSEITDAARTPGKRSDSTRREPADLLSSLMQRICNKSEPTPRYHRDPTQSMKIHLFIRH
jgi:hypothetical protein